MDLPAHESPSRLSHSGTIKGGRSRFQVKTGALRNWIRQAFHQSLSAGLFSRRRLAIALSAAAYACVLAYGSWTRDRAKRPAAVTIPVPAPSQSIAAIKALPPPNLLKPISPEAATKVNSERPFVRRPDSAAARFILRADADDRTRALTCLAQAIYYEAAGEGVDGGRAVAQVVLNRMRHPGFPSTICGVVYEGADRATGCQFSFTCDGSMQRIPVASLWARSKKIAEEALEGKVFREIGHATHYHADYVLPYWADALDKSVQVGRHIFYRLPSGLGDPRAFSQRYSGTEPQVREPGRSNAVLQPLKGQQLADDLINGPPQDGPKANNLISEPATVLMIDQTPSKLLADGGNDVQIPRRRKSSGKCSATVDRAQLGPLKATNLRSDSTPSGC